MAGWERVIAIDWSGDRSARVQRRKIVACTVACLPGGGLAAQISAGRTRDETAAWLQALVADQCPTVVGLDFAFGFPVGSIPQQAWLEALDYVSRHAETILQACPPPFWGRAGRLRRAEPALRRWIDQVCPGSPASIFQLVGAGQVGVASLRGMATILQLRRVGWHVWPFDGPPAGNGHAGIRPVVMEIYPRLAYGAVRKGQAAARAAFLDVHLPSIAPDVHVPPAALAAARAGDDTFDALVAGLAIWRALHTHGTGFDQYDPAFYAHPQIRFEGWIFGVPPAGPRPHATGSPQPRHGSTP